MKRALLVIHMQNAYVGENRAKRFKYDTQSLIENVNKRIAIYDHENVIYIIEDEKKNFINMIENLFTQGMYEGSKEAAFVDGLSVVNTHVFNRDMKSFFFNRQMDKMLKERQIDQLELVGVDGGGAVGMTADFAVKAGYNVCVWTKAVGTRSIKRTNSLRSKLEAKGVVFV